MKAVIDGKLIEGKVSNKRTDFPINIKNKALRYPKHVQCDFETVELCDFTFKKAKKEVTITIETSKLI